MGFGIIVKYKGVNIVVVWGFCGELCCDCVWCVGGGHKGVGVLVVKCANEVRPWGCRCIFSAFPELVGDGPIVSMNAKMVLARGYLDRAVDCLLSSGESMLLCF